MDSGGLMAAEHRRWQGGDGGSDLGLGELDRGRRGWVTTSGELRMDSGAWPGLDRATRELGGGTMELRCGALGLRVAGKLKGQQGRMDGSCRGGSMTNDGSSSVTRHNDEDRGRFDRGLGVTAVGAQLPTEDRGSQVDEEARWSAAPQLQAVGWWCGRSKKEKRRRRKCSSSSSKEGGSAIHEGTGGKKKKKIGEREGVGER